MRDHNLLLERRIKQSGVPRRHEGRIAVAIHVDARTALSSLRGRRQTERDLRPGLL